MDLKQRAAEAALEFISDGMIVGLGTGSTVEYFLIALGQAVAAGKLRNIRGVPTSVRSEQRARELGIPLASLVQCPHPDVTVDGADEVTPSLDLIKGMGGALLREKIIAQASRKLVIIADQSKAVQTLGTHSPLPVEVAVFAHETHVNFFRSLGAEPELRCNADGSPFLTDNSNYIYHCRFKQIEAPRMLELALKSRAGIVETGLFLNLATTALIASPTDVRRLDR